MEFSLIIGDYKIYNGTSKESLWISKINDEDYGEGGEFNLEDLVKVIDKFYKENF